MNCVFKSVVYLFGCKNHQALKNFEIDLIITDMRIRTLWRTKKLNKNQFILISRKALTKEEVIAELV